MASLPESAVYTAGIYQIEDGDNGTGGPDGIANAATRALANRTAYLKAQSDALAAAVALSAKYGPEMPVAALPWPTIASANNKLVITAAGGVNGGTVLVGAGQRFTLAASVVAGVTGRAASWVTEAWESQPLLVSTTYFLRGQIDEAGELLIYVARGTDADPIPSGRRGTDGASSGCGFQSTEQDILFARIVTGVSGSVPTVTSLENSFRLERKARISAELPATKRNWGATAHSPVPNTGLTLNWARPPTIVIPAKSGEASRSPDMWGTASTEGVGIIAIRETTYDRYAVADVDYLFDDDTTHTRGWVEFNWYIAA